MESYQRPEAQELDGAPIPVLVEYLTHDDPSLRGDAACALGDRLRAREVPCLDDAVLNRLAELLDDEVPIVRLEAAIALAEARDTRATSILLTAMEHRTFRLDAVRALGTLQDPAAIPPLQRLMSRWLMPWADKLQAAAALCALGDASGARYLQERLQSRKHAERAAAIHFIGESQHPQALSLLTNVLASPQDPMRDVAARALGFLAHPDAQQALEAARQGAPEEMRQDIDESLARIARVLAT